MSLQDKLKTYPKEYDLSDIHIRSNQPFAIRENGEIKVFSNDVISRQDIESFWKQSLDKAQYDYLITNGDLDFAVVVDGQRFRANGYYSSYGPSMVLRKIISEIPNIEKLGLPPAAHESITHKTGLVLVTGQTGSGKSTSLAAMIDQINSHRAENIITIEDPIEFVHPAKKSIISQREVGKDTGSFAKALKSALRQDPDVILVGEMRDLETISLALTAAETGHLVFGTLHASSASSTITRILDVFPPAQKEQAQTMLAGSIRLVMSQQLLKRKGGGRIGCHEVMTGTPAIRNLIREGKTEQIQSTLQTSAKDGMFTMEKCLEGLKLKKLVE
ncbi:type IV pilus twitching motility protein PilT [Candidatus Pelagibacter sp.]|jgi:twitching motility protein PilT|uniref:type IV pilus twitching motility protein PilT n=1 Tax=Candidatus Pelagibacter sp. TaxID=2024849 RepID=UPI003F86FA8D